MKKKITKGYAVVNKKSRKIFKDCQGLCIDTNKDIFEFFDFEKYELVQVEIREIKSTK